MANSFVRYTGNNSTTSYSIPFSYRATSDLTVTLSGVVTTAYTLNSAGTTLTFNTAPAQDVAIEIRRRTSQGTKLVDYASGSVLTENDLDTDSDQAFFMSQEAIDDAGDVIKVSNVNFQWDTQNKRLTNVADPVNNTDAVNKQFISTNLPNITTVAGIASDVTTVANNDANITAVANDATDIGTVATNIASVNTVATNISDVIKVADDLNEAISEVETVANDLNEATSEIEVVANNITNVNTVGNNISNVNTVAGIDANVTTVAGISADVTSVAGISTAVSNVNSNSTNINAVNANSANINTVAGIDSDVTSVAGISSAVSAVNSNSTNINAVNANSTNINSVAGNATNINTVAGNNSNITTVAGISSNVTTVAGISSDVSAVAGDATDIGTVATNLTGTNTIGTVAGSIANVNNVGGSIANVNTVAGNLSGVNYFGERYRVSATAPTTSLDVGDLYYDTATDAMKVYGSSGWQNAGSSVNGTSQRYNYTAISGQTTFTGSDNNGNTLTYDAGYIDVYLNGVKLLNGTDVTVTSGSSVVLATGATAGDVVDIVAYGTFSVASLNADNLDSGTVPDGRITGAYTGITNLTMSGDLTVDTNTLYVDSTNNRVGIGTSSPEEKLDFGDGFQNLRAGLRTYLGAGYSSGGTILGHTVKAKDSSTDGASPMEVIETNSSGGAPSAIRMHYGNIEFHTASSGTANALFDSERMRIYETGAVLLGTTTVGSAGAGDLSVNGGIFLGGTGTANKLDDYEEGTWTPQYVNGPTLSYAYGEYTKIGQIVHVIARLYRNDANANTNTLELGNLPFAVAYDSSTGIGHSGLGHASSYGGTTNRKHGMLDTSSGNVKLIKDGTLVHSTYDNFHSNARIATYKWSYVSSA